MIRLLFAMLAAALLAACATAPPAPVRTVRGVLLDVRADSLTRFDSVRLRSDDGREWTFRPAPGLEQDPNASPGHLRLHLAAVDHLTVTYRETPQGLLAEKFEDN